MPITPDDRAARGVLWQTSGSGRAGRFWLNVPGVARYLVEGGESITVESDGGDEAAIRQFLGTTPLAAALYQQGMLALHAAAIYPFSQVGKGAGGDEGPGAILLAGESGAGKSTLLAALAQHGGIPLSDDLTPLGLDEQERVVVYANPGPIRLWPDTLRELGVSEPLEAGISTGEPFHCYPLRAIYWLSVRSQAAVEMQAIQGMGRFDAPSKLSYNTHIADALLERPAYFKIAAAIAQQVPIIRLRRPRGIWRDDELCQKIGLSFDHYTK